MVPDGVTEHEPDTLEDALLPAGVYVAVPLDAGLTVTVLLEALPPPVALDATYFEVVLGVTVVVYVFGTATVPLAESLYARSPRVDRSPNSAHIPPDP